MSLPAYDKTFEYLKKNNNETGLVSKIVQNGEEIYYRYDKRGNISEVYENSELTTKYQYDAVNRLIRENNAKLNKSYTFTYDNNGNIRFKKVYPYSPDIDTIDLTNGEEIEYNYDGDKLLSFNNKECEYDALGNPTTYLDKKASWSHISHLRRLGNVSFDYNASGMRTSKSKGSNKIKYYYAGDKLLAESRYIEHCDFPDDIDEGYSSKKPICDIQYIYGSNGITGFRLRQAYTTNWTDYYYRKNLQGDVTHIVDTNSVVKAEYVYDAWGNHRVISNNTTIYDSTIGITAGYENHIGNINPFRYRSYYFDVETGLFYLQNRYYDPLTGRFIS